MDSHTTMPALLSRSEPLQAHTSTHTPAHMGATLARGQTAFPSYARLILVLAVLALALTLYLV